MEPTVTTVITWVAGGLVTALVVYLFTRLGRMEDKHDGLERDYRQHLTTLPEKYVGRDDYRADVQEIKAALKELTQYFHDAVR